MDTIILITHRYLQFYSFAKLKTANTRIALIVDENCTAEIPESQKPYLDAIYEVPSCLEKSQLSVLDYAKCHAAITTELEINSDKNHVYLLCEDEKNLMLTANLTDAFALTGINAETMLLFRDKVAMKQKLRDAGVRVPKYTKLANMACHKDIWLCFNKIIQKVGFPFVVKPIKAVACINVNKITNFTEFKNFVLSDQFWYVNYEAEEFIDGKLYHCDSAAYNNEIIFSECGVYAINPLEVRAGKIGATLILEEDDPVRSELLTFTKRALEVLTMPNCVTHMEVFRTTRGELIFLEVGARMPGGMITPNYQQQFDLNLVDLAFLIKTNRFTQQAINRKTNCFNLFVPAQTGTITQLNIPSLQSKFILNWNVDVGVHVTGNSLYNRIATLIVWNDDYKTLEKDFIEIQQHPFAEYNLLK